MHEFLYRSTQAKFLLRFLLMGLLLNACVCAETSEYRALWVTRYELTSTKNITKLVQAAADNNFNTLFIQVCGRGTAFYNSQLIPRDSSAPSTDMLAYCLTEAKKNKIAVHAWVNALYVWSESTKNIPAKHVVITHPEWLLVSTENTRNKYLNPEIPEARQYVRAIVKELTTYPIQGIHLDYIRYPAPYYKDATENAVTLLVQEIKTDLLSKNILLSAAVVGDPEKARTQYLQNWQAWAESGKLDIIIPMLYDKDTEVVARQILQVASLAERSKQRFIIGLGAWRRPPQEVVENILFMRHVRETLGSPYLTGISLFSYDALIKQHNYLHRLKDLVFNEN